MEKEEPPKPEKVYVFKNKKEAIEAFKCLLKEKVIRKNGIKILKCSNITYERS